MAAWSPVRKLRSRTLASHESRMRVHRVGRPGRSERQLWPPPTLWFDKHFKNLNPHPVSPYSNWWRRLPVIAGRPVLSKQVPPRCFSLTRHVTAFIISSYDTASASARLSAKTHRHSPVCLANCRTFCSNSRFHCLTVMSIAPIALNNFCRFFARFPFIYCCRMSAYRGGVGKGT